MQLKMLKDSAISLLKKEISKNIENYNSNEPWIDEYFKENDMSEYYIKLNLAVDNINLVIGDQSTDAQNSVIIHKAMKNLLPIYARDEKLWAYLTHTVCYEYMKNRWKTSMDEKKISRVESRYFFQGKYDSGIIKNSTVPYVRNGLSRLWWAGYIVYDPSLNNPYEYIDELFVSQDMFVGLCERDISKNKTLVMSILKNVRKYNIKDIEKNTELVRNILKDINLSAGLVMYDSLDESSINNRIEHIFEKNILEYKNQ